VSCLFKIARYVSFSMLFAFLLSVQGMAASKDDIVSGELLVKFRGGNHSVEANLANYRAAAVVLRNFEIIGWQHVKLPEGMSLRSGAEFYRHSEGIEAVEFNYKRTASVIPNDPQYSAQYALPLIGMPEAWETTTGASNVVIAVIDSGVDYNHEDLEGNIWTNPEEIPDNGIDDDGNGYVDDVHGIDAWDHDSDPMDEGIFNTTFRVYHGTHCAGIIGAVGQNAKGIAGLNWSVKILPLRFIGTENFGSDAGAIECMEYLIQLARRGVPIRAVNDSWGGGLGSRALRESFQAVEEEGIINVLSAGNGPINHDVDPDFPASFGLAGSISVAASDSSDSRASFSDYGANSVHLFAPGVSIASTAAGDKYASFSGTSFAAPHVAGAVGLLYARFPEMAPASIKAAILQSATSVPALSGLVITHGRLNVASALNLAGQSNLPPAVVYFSPLGPRASRGQPIEIGFSQSMDRQSVESAWDVVPSISGVFEWNEENTLLRFLPGTRFAAEEYTVSIRGSARASEGQSLDGNFNALAEGVGLDDFVWKFRLAPANDEFAYPAILGGFQGTFDNSNRGATSEYGEPQIGNLPGDGSVWFSWTAPKSGWISFDTAGTPFNTMLGVYLGGGVSNLGPVAVSWDYGTDPAARVTFEASLGETYFLLLDGQPDWGTGVSQSGTYRLAWSPAAPPLISSVQPPSAALGGIVRLSGKNFSGTTNVSIGGISAEFQVVSDRTVEVRIPANAASGAIVMLAGGGGGADESLLNIESSFRSVSVIPAGSSWKYEDQADVFHGDWLTMGYDDSSWAVATAPLGYGFGLAASPIEFGGNPDRKRITTLFRKTFFIRDASSILSARLRLWRNDGAAVFLNETNVLTSNLSPTFGDDSFAFNEAGIEPEELLVETKIPAGYLHSGLNVLAAEVHQASSYGPDIWFDAALEISELDGPRVQPDGSGESLEISWAIQPPGLVLESTASLNPPHWERVIGLARQENGRNIMTVSKTSDARYYRLKL
jgi:subtilisin family serine protease